MKTITQTIKVQNPNFGVILNESFIEPIQFKLFLKMVNGCFSTKSDLTFFNGQDFFIHIPFEVLKNSIINTTLQSEPYTLTELVKSKIEQP